MDLVWKKDVQHGRAHIIKVECAYIPHAQISEFLNSERNHEDSLMERNIYKQVSSQENVKMSRIQNHLGHTWYDVLLFIFVIWNLFFNLILYQNLGPKLISHFVGMHVGMGQKIIVETHITIDPLNGVI
jgi:Fe2+ transport system protein B